MTLYAATDAAMAAATAATPASAAAASAAAVEGAEDPADGPGRRPQRSNSPPACRSARGGAGAGGLVRADCKAGGSGGCGGLDAGGGDPAEKQQT